MILSFPQTHNPWVDAGIIGFSWFVEPFLPADVSLRVMEDRLDLEGEEADLKAFLETSFNRLVDEWYNASSAKQEQEAAGYYFDPETKTFPRFGRTLPKGLTALLFDVAARNYEGPAWGKEKDGKGKTGQDYSMLNPEEAIQWTAKAGLDVDLQGLLDNFLLEAGLWSKGKIRPKSGTKVLLWGRKNLRIPNVACWADDAKPKGVCVVSGELLGKVANIDGKSLPFAVGSSGHVNFSPDWRGSENIGWKAEFMALFAPVAGFWKGGHGDPHLIGAIPVAGNLQTLKSNVAYLKGLIHEEESLQGNFEIKLKALKFTREPEERFIAFFERLFHLTLQADGDEPLDEFENYEFFKLPKEIDSGAPTSFFLTTAHKGVKWDILSADVYQDPIYLLRLFSRMFVRDPEYSAVDQSNGHKDEGDDNQWQGVKLNFPRFLNQLWDTTKKKERGGQDGTPLALLTRRLVLRNILNKKPVLKHLERHAFSINKESGKTHSVSELLAFAEIYEPLFWSENMVENRDRFLEAAKQLGERIAIVVHGHDNGRKNRLYKLRRARTLAAFLNEINTLQERFGLTAPEGLATGLVTPANFEEFRGFSLLNALNKFNSMAYAKSKKGD